MASRKIWTLPRSASVIIVGAIVLLALFTYFDRTPSKGETRITQNIIIHSYEPTNYTITTSLLYFDGKNWKDLSTWERDVPISKISATKAYLQSEAEKRQKLVKAALQEFYKQP